MGAGRRTQTFILNEKANSSAWAGGGGNFKNLRRSDLAGVIFGCSHQTLKECLSQLIFGLPAHHFAYVQSIEPGMPLFLFNYSDRKMHGTFEAASHGKMNINPYAWTTDGSEKTQFPAQVRVCIRQHCQPLSEHVFRNAISENYYTNSHFWFELNHAQTDSLMSLFLSTSTRRCSEIDFQKSVENDEWLSKRAPSSSNAWQMTTSFISTTLGHAQVGTEVTASGAEWPVLSRDSEGVFPSQEDALEQNRQPSWKEHLNGECIASSDGSSLGQSMDCKKAIVLDEETTTMDKVMKSLSPLAKHDLRGKGSTSNESKENRELVVLEKLKHLAINRREFSRNLGSDVASKDPKDIVNLQSDNDIEYLRTENLDQDQALLRREKERLLCSLSSVDPTITESLQNYLELHTLTVTQMQQDINELRFRLDQTCTEFTHMREIMDLVKKNVLLEQKQADMDSEIQMLKGQVKGLHELLPRTEAVTSQDESAEILLPEQSHGSDLCIYLLGGNDGNSWLGALDMYSPTTDIIRSLEPMPTARSYAAATVLDGNIYIFGGGNGVLWYNSVEQYNPTSDYWTSCPSMTLERGSLAGASLENKIFAFGGGNGVEYFSEVEMYDPLLGKWLLYGSMLQKRFALAGAALGGALYALGGFDGKQYLKSVERFDPREARWVQLEEMSSKRGSLSVAVLNEKLYAMGGYDGSKFLSSLEVYDPRAGSWLMGDPIASPRGYAATAVLGDSVYMIGGLGERGYVDSVESFRDGFGWQVLNSRAIGKRSFLAAVVL